MKECSPRGFLLRAYSQLGTTRHLVLTPKSLSETRRSCRWEAVKVVTEQMSKIIKALFIFAYDKDKKTYTDSRALMNAICDFEFVFGVILLKMILLNTNSLSRYLQAKGIDVITVSEMLTLPSRRCVTVAKKKL